MVKDHITYFSGKFLVKQSDDWSLKQIHLPGRYFEKEFNNKDYPKLAFFNTYKTKFFAIDIDAHDNDLYALKKAYEELLIKFAEPSFVVKSPNGYHVYYLLSEFYSSQILINSVQLTLRNFVHGNRMEVRPTVNSGLRIPNIHHIIDMNNMTKFLRFNIDSFCKFLDNAPHYHPEEFCNTSLFESNKTKVIPSDIIIQGGTNMALNYYVPLWRSKGLNKEQITNKFIENLEPGYVGECTNYNRVFKRVSSYFKNYEPRKMNTLVQFDELSKKYKELIESILSLYTNENKYNEKLRLSSIKEDLIKILSFYEISMKIYNDKSMLYEHAEKNPFFIYELSRECIPISSTSIRIKNLKFFKEIGFISLPYGKHYNVQLHSCIHYKLNFEKFLIKTITSTSSNKTTTSNSIYLDNHYYSLTVNSRPNICFILFNHSKDNKNVDLVSYIEPPPKKRIKVHEVAISKDNLEDLFID